MKKYTKSKDIKVGVLGYGGAFNMGLAHMNEMKRAGMSPFAVCEIDPARLEVATQDFPGIETYSSLDEMLKNSDVDLIVHITPHNLHYSLAAKCIKAGKHVVTEKPFVITTKEADKLIDLAQKNDVMVSTYHNRHWDGWILKAVQKIVKQNCIGEVRRAELHMGSYGMPQAWWRTSNSVSGGVLYDWGVHLLEYALQVIDSEIVEVSGFATRGYWEAKAPKNFPWIGDMNEDEAIAIVRFANGAIIHLCISNLNTLDRPEIVFAGTKGSYEIKMWGEEEGWHTKTPNVKGEIVHKHGAHAKGAGHLFYKNIAEYLTGQAELIITPEWARRPIHILDLAKQSAEKNKTLKAKYS